MWDIELKATHEQTRKTNNPKLTDTDDFMVVTRRKEVEGACKGFQIYFDT